MGFKFRIEYKKGSMNRAADALSRRETDDLSAASVLSAIAHPVPALLDTLRSETADFSQLIALKNDILAGTAPSHLSYIDGLIYYNRRIYVAADSPSKQVLLHEHHSTLAAGHPGVDRTFKRIAASFFWPRMRKDVKHFVAACVDCQTTKYSTQKPAGLLQPLPIPSQVWDDVSMDFVTGLPPSRGYTVIMVVVDRLSKYAHFAALPTRFDAMRIARLFIDTVVKHHGFPKTLVSDRDTVFLNAVWEHMLRLSGTKLHFSTAYHPHSDGQTEVRNRGLEQYLRTFASDRPSKWTNFLPWAELALNCFHHEGLGTSPFHALYGREPPPLVAAPPSRTTPPSVAELIRDRGALLVDLRKNLERAQQRMRDTANRHRRDVHFQVGDLVLLKLQQYRQHSVARPLSAKLARRYYGPFKVLEKIGQVAYHLQLPSGARIHDVFHVGLLRKFVQGEPGPPIAELPAELISSRPLSRPMEILEQRVVLHAGHLVQQVLVRWSGEEQPTPTWEPLQEIARRFPSILLGDKEVLNGEGVDTISQTQDTLSPRDDEPAAETQERAPTLSEQPTRMNPRPRRETKPPGRYQDYVRS